MRKYLLKMTPIDLKLQFVIMSALYILCFRNIEGKPTSKDCLDFMREKSSLICDIVIEPAPRRWIREISETSNHSLPSIPNRYYYDQKRHTRPINVRINHPTFPPGGYIVYRGWHPEFLRVPGLTYQIIPQVYYTTRRNGSEYNRAIDYHLRVKRMVAYATFKPKTKKVNYTYCCEETCLYSKGCTVPVI